ncbi:MAG: hypothetical protein ACFCGT_28220 [Sandaracinaceae bacterium]
MARTGQRFLGPMLVLVLVLVLAAAGACGGSTEPAGRAPAAEGAAESRGPAVLRGVVRLADGAALPTYPEPPLEQEGADLLPEACTPAGEADRTPFVLGGERGLAGVVVALRRFPGRPQLEPRTREVRIEDCRLTPKLVTATRGDVLRVTNATDHPFFPQLGGAERIMQMLMPEGSRDFELDQGGVRNLLCGYATPCGRTEIAVFYHPFHQVTGTDGRFVFEDPPIGDDIELGAWHPLLSEATEVVTTRAGQEVEVTLTLSPPPARPAAPPEPPPLYPDPDARLTGSGEPSGEEPAEGGGEEEP